MLVVVIHFSSQRNTSIRHMQWPSRQVQQCLVAVCLTILSSSLLLVTVMLCAKGLLVLRVLPKSRHLHLHTWCRPFPIICRHLLRCCCISTISISMLYPMHLNLRLLGSFIIQMYRIGSISRFVVLPVGGIYLQSSFLSSHTLHMPMLEPFQDFHGRAWVVTAASSPPDNNHKKKDQVCMSQLCALFLMVGDVPCMVHVLMYFRNHVLMYAYFIPMPMDACFITQ